MKGNRVGLGQGSGRERVSGGGHFSRDPFYAWYYTRLCTGMCEYTLYLQCDSVIFNHIFEGVSL